MNIRSLISVVVPTYNGQTYIAQTLQSVMSQTHAAVEIIVVDDGSTDETIETVRRVCPAARLIHQKNSRVSAARNKGFAAAAGDFVCFLDQDDVWHPEHLARQMRHFDLHPELGAVFSHFIVWRAAGGAFPEPTSLWGTDQRQTDCDPARAGWIYHQFLSDCIALTSATMIRRSVLLQHGQFDPNRHYSEDWDLWLRLSLEVQFGRVGWPAVLYRQHPVQGSREVRAVDYRTELLLENVARHGYASRDGRAINADAFNQQIAQYQMAFGYHHLQFGDRRKAAHSLFQSWKRNPLAFKSLVLAAAALVGWRPRQTG